ncbi:hypothetical protein ACLMJK_009070 [Lecanora helva]
MFERWHYFVASILSKSQCNGEVLVDGEWYGLKDPTDATRTLENFDVCPACHAGLNQSADFGQFFNPRNFPPGTSRVCDFNPTAPRYSQWIDKWNQMYFIRNAASLIDYVSRLATIPECKGTQRLQNAN